MRVLLLHTNQFDFGQLPRTVEGQRGLNPPISLAYVAAVAKQHNHVVRLLDIDAELFNITKLKQFILSFHPDVVGFSVMLNNFNTILNLSNSIKSWDSTIKIVWGGVQMNTFPENMIQYPPIDVGFIGEAEKTFPMYLDAIEKHQDLQTIEGIIYKQNGKIIRTKDSRPIERLDDIPFPARELLLNKKYTSLIATRTPVTILFTSRGCPYHCTFCSKPSFWNQWRIHSPKYVGDEFERCSELGIKEIMVYDDVFTINPKRVEEICREIISRKLDITFDIRTRVDKIDEPSLKMLQTAGCQRICYGVESGDPEMLKTYDKRISIEQAKIAFDLTHRYKMDVLAYYMIGGPNETQKSIQNTIQSMLFLNPDFVHITHVIPYPKTKLYEIAMEKGLMTADTWLDMQTHSFDSFPMFTDGQLSREDIFKAVKKAYRSFYMRPKYILGRLKRIRSIGQLYRYFRAALSI